MADELVPDERRAPIAELAPEEQRVVIRVRPYATFATLPRTSTRWKPRTR